MSDWDASDNEDLATSTSKLSVAPVAAIIPKKPSRFADEDAEDDIKDDWDAESEEEEKNKPTGPAPPVRKKGITKQKIAEKEALEKAKEEKRAAMLAEEQDPKARQRAARERELRADLENARGLFGDAAVDAAMASDDPFAMDPHTKQEFATLSERLAEIIIEKYGNKALFASFVEEHVKALCQPLKDLEVRKCASTLSTLANEKQKAAKEAAGGKKKGKTTAKPTLVAGRGVASRADTAAYEDALDDDFDDFM